MQTGDDTETLTKVEARIQAKFKNGLPPHLLPNAKSLTYTPGSDQSRIFVASHSEFLNLHARDIQRILRDRLILVHGNPFDHKYGWDLESFGLVHDVDKKITVHGEIIVNITQFILLNTMFSFIVHGSPQARTSPSSGNTETISLTYHHPIER